MAKNGVALRGNTLPANWEQRMAAKVAKTRQQVASIAIGQFMSIRGGVLKFQDQPMPGNKMQCVILDAKLENSYYGGEDFDPKNPIPPVCYAFGDDDKEMSPHAESEKKQSETCATCKWAKFGTASKGKGKGKACKNGVRFGLIHADSLKSGIDDATVAILKIPPTSLKGYRAFVDSLEGLGGGGALFSVVTEISVVPDPVTQFKVICTPVKAITDKKTLGALFLRSEGLQLDFPYQAAPEAPAGRKKASREAPAAQGKGKGGGKKAASAAAALAGKTRF